MINIDYLINTQEVIECRFKVDNLKDCTDISDILCVLYNHYQADTTWFGSEIKELIELNKINIIKITRNDNMINIENSIVVNNKSITLDVNED